MHSKYEKIFENYVFLPVEIRMMVINELQLENRVRFTRCSKACNKEAKASKNYIHSLSIMATETVVCIIVSHNKCAPMDKEALGYFLKFERNCETKKKYIECTTANFKVLWRDELDKSTDFLLQAAELFKQLLKLHQNKIKKLCMNGTAFRGRLWKYDFEIEHLNNVEVLGTNYSSLSSRHLSKIRRPLKCLSICGSGSLASFEQIYQVQDQLYLGDTKLNYEQMLRLAAQNVSMLIGILSEQDIFNFVTCWQNGTIEKNMKNYEWDLKEPTAFNIPKLFRLFGVEYSDERNSITFKQDKKDGPSAFLTYHEDHYYPTLKFRVVTA